MEDEFEENKLERGQRGLEKFIILILGSTKKRISVLHLEKEAFLLWNFSKDIKKYLKFIPHYRGPFSREIQESVLNPMYSEDFWNYIPPKRGDKISGGYLELTDRGKKEYKRLMREISKQEKLMHLIVGVKMVAELYSKLSLEELLLLIYDTYPGYTKKSIISKDIEKKRKSLAERLMKKKMIDKERYELLLGEMAHG